MFRKRSLSRRNVLKTAGLLGAGAALGTPARWAFGEEPGPQRTDADRKLLFVFVATGGASMGDAFLPVAESEVSSPELASRLNVYPDDLIGRVQGSAIRHVITPQGVITGGGATLVIDYSLRDFVVKHGSDMVVMAASVSSVAHSVAAVRAMTGDGIDSGRTICEASTIVHGEGLLLPSCNMARDGYLDPGIDVSVPSWARAEIVDQPRDFSLLMNGTEGIAGLPAHDRIIRARSIRDELDDHSVFGQTFGGDPRRAAYIAARANMLPEIEAADLIAKLSLRPEGSVAGVPASPLRSQLLDYLPDLDVDSAQAQAALAIALTHYGVSASVVFGASQQPRTTDIGLSAAPLAFDYSHSAHRAAQGVMWSSSCKTLDGLITALKQLDYLGDPSLGKMWDRSLIYVATEFGREQFRPPGSQEWGAGHSLNNANLLISPLLRGNRVFGGVDPDTCLTYGFDTRTGEPDPGIELKEGHVYSAVAQAMGVEFARRHDMSAVVRG